MVSRATAIDLLAIVSIVVGVAISFGIAIACIVLGVFTLAINYIRGGGS